MSDHSGGENIEPPEHDDSLGDELDDIIIDAEVVEEGDSDSNESPSDLEEDILYRTDGERTEDPKLGDSAVPNLIQHVIGFRTWQPSNGTLMGRAPWVPGENKARCNGGLGSHKAPNLQCGCGLYAYHEGVKLGYGVYGPVEGAIKAWGKMCVADRGFRAEFAEVIALLRPKNPKSIIEVEHIAYNYAVPICDSVKALKEYAYTKGIPMDSTLRPSSGASAGVYVGPQPKQKISKKSTKKITQPHELGPLVKQREMQRLKEEKKQEALDAKNRAREEERLAKKREEEQIKAKKDKILEESKHWTVPDGNNVATHGKSALAAMMVMIGVVGAFVAALLGAYVLCTVLFCWAIISQGYIWTKT